MSHLTPTPEQSACVDAARTKQHLVIEALAGTGKTATLTLIAEAMGKFRRGSYVAFNKSIVTDAEKRFPSTVTCKTAHSLAFRAVGVRFKERLNQGRTTAVENARRLGVLNSSLEVAERIVLDGVGLVQTAQDTIRSFLRTMDLAPGIQHMRRDPGMEDGDLEILASVVLPIAQDIWDDFQQPYGKLGGWSHDVYLKLWAHGDPIIGSDYVMLDEAQDADPVIRHVVSSQPCQQIYVGDTNQQIYAWRGAINALAQLDETVPRKWLTQSFRFGQGVADVANDYLDVLGAPELVRGDPNQTSTVEPIDAPDAILCRTNASCLAAAMASLAAGKRVALVGGTDDLSRFLTAALQLQRGQRTKHHDLACFKTWGNAVAWVKSHRQEAGDLAVKVGLVEKFGAEALRDVLDDLTADEGRADVIVSTAHKAKGREWPRVQIASDFSPELDVLPDGELRLGYVAVTRARKTLDVSRMQTKEDRAIDRELERLADQAI